MKDLFEYITECGDKTFEQMPFNEVDSLIFSRLSYFNFNDFKGMALKDIFNDYVFSTEYKSSKKLLAVVSQAKRYQFIKVVDCISAVDSGIKFHFSACTLNFGKDLYYISFAGTVKSFASFYEDASMAYCYPMVSEKLALSYTEKVCNTFNNGKFYIGGHSKGGSFALYSYVCAADDVKSKICAVYNYDGPGLPENIKPSLNKDDLLKIHLIMPQDSIIGRIYDNDLEVKIIKSRSFFIYQHNPFRWNIKDNRFVRQDGFTFMSTNISKFLDRCMNRVDKSEWQFIGDGINNAAQSVGIKNDDEPALGFAKLFLFVLIKSVKG